MFVREKNLKDEYRELVEKEQAEKEAKFGQMEAAKAVKVKGRKLKTKKNK